LSSPYRSGVSAHVKEHSMRHRFAIALLAALSAWTSPALAAPRVVVCLIPGENCTKLVVDTVDAAAREVLVQAYGFTSCPIIEALARARKRGLDVRVLLDKSNVHPSKAAVLSYLRSAGIEPKIDSPPGIAHRKVIIVDRNIVVSGSMNFTCAAQKRNVEVVEVTRGRKRAKPYIGGWSARDAVSRPAPSTAQDLQLSCRC
jgi:phosphatidylserine/phosphatidylglycerophosphate/cardiolipin synthase-like enzyme